MLRILCFLIIFMCLTKLTHAQKKAKYLTTQYIQQSSGQVADTLSIKLKLTSPQKISIDSVERIFLAQRVALGNELTSEERKAAIGKIQQEKTRQLQKILSVEQYRLYTQLIEDQKKLVESKQKQLRERNKNQ